MHSAFLKSSNLDSISSGRRKKDRGGTGGIFFHKKRFSINQSEVCRTTDPFGVVGFLASMHIHRQNWNIGFFGISECPMFELLELGGKKSDCNENIYIEETTCQ
jgi:hypothetical protein